MGAIIGQGDADGWGRVGIGWGDDVFGATGEDGGPFAGVFGGDDMAGFDIEEGVGTVAKDAAFGDGGGGVYGFAAHGFDGITPELGDCADGLMIFQGEFSAWWKHKGRSIT